MDLTQAAKDSLRVLATSPGWQVLLNVVEAKVHAAETDLLKIQGHDSVKILAAHNRARAFWELFEVIQSEVNTAVEVFPESKALTPKEIMLASIQN